jgi:Fe(3+) dicitrate transport protein
MINNIKYIIVVLAICPCFLFSQIRISGKVLDSKTNAPIEGVEVFDDISAKVVVTNSNGMFEFDKLIEGNHILTFFGMNYNALNHFIKVQNESDITVRLDKLSFDMTAVEIAAKREELFALKQLKDVEGTSIYAGKKTEVVVLDLVAGNLASNISRQVYAQVSGLNIYEGSEGGLQLAIGGRGLDPNRTSNFNTRQNGYDISADVLGYPESYYTPPTEALSEIKIIRGASSLQYGSQFGGLINFKLREIPSFKKLEIRTNQTYGSNGFFNTFNAFGINHKKLSINTFYNFKRGDGFRSNSEFESNNVFFSLGYKLSDRTRISGEFTYLNYLAKQAGGLTDQQFKATPQLSTRDRNWFNVDWKLFNFKFEHSISDETKLSLSVFGLDAERNSLGFRGDPINLNENPITALDEQDVNGNYILPRDLIKGGFNNYGTELKFLTRYNLKSKKSVLLVGAKYYKSSNTSFQGPGTTSALPEFDNQVSSFPDYPSQSNFEFPNLNLAFFGENIFYLSEKISITPGFRIEHINTKSEGVYNQVVFDNAGNPIANSLLSEKQDFKRSFALFGLGFNYKKHEHLIFNANLSQNYRSVTFNDIRVVSPTFIVDPNITDESGFTADFGVRGRFKKVLSYDIGVYSILYNDRIGIILDERANRVRKNIGKALIGGLESLIDVNVVKLFAENERNFKIRYFANTAITFSEYLSSEENNVVGKTVEFVPKVNLKTGLILGYKNLMTSLQFSYLSQQFTDVQNSLSAGDGDKRSGIIGEIPSYSILDFTMSYQLESVKFEAGVNNVLDESYFTQRATGYPGPGIIPSNGRTFFVTIGYKY